MEYAQEQARGLIGTLMLVTGLAGSVFLPVTAFLDHLIGWRDALLVYAAVMALAVGPLLWFGLPATEATAAVAARRGAGSHGRIFVLLVAAIALNSFVTFGIQAVGVPLLQAMGMDLARAVAVASLLGVFKVGGRVLDLLGGGRWDGLSTGIAAGAVIPLGLVAIWIGGAGLLPVVGYLLLFGVGSGAFAVARATMPLVFFDKAGYAAAMAAIALPMNLINALAPPALAVSMEQAGPRQSNQYRSPVDNTVLARPPWPNCRSPWMNHDTRLPSSEWAPRPSQPVWRGSPMPWTWNDASGAPANAAVKSSGVALP